MKYHSETELKAMKTADVAAFYNEVAESKNFPTVARFADKAAAIRRAMQLQDKAGLKPTPHPMSVAKDKAQPKRSANPNSKKPFGYHFVFPCGQEQKVPREGTKRRKLFDKMMTAKGVTHAEVMELCDWDKRTAYEGIRLIHYAHGYPITQDETTGRVRVNQDLLK